MRTFINSLGNLFIKPLLRSPLHFFVSGSLMLVTFTGRKSGTVYATPVQYFRDDDTIVFFTNKLRAWWKNLTSGRPVTLRIKGRDVQAVGVGFIDDPAAVAQGLQQMYPRVTPERADDMARQTIMVQLKAQ